MINTNTAGSEEGKFPKGPPSLKEFKAASQAQASDSVRENLKDKLGVMNLESEGVHVENDGTVLLDREFMINALKEKGVEVHPDLSPKNVATQFLAVLGDEFKFLSGAKNVKAKGLPSLTELQSKMELPDVDNLAA